MLSFSLSNLVSGVTCSKSLVASSIDLMLTNKPKRFHHANLIETGMSDGHKMIFSLLRDYFKRMLRNL